MRPLASLEDALPLLSVSDQLIFGLPLSAVVAQRLRLPTVDPQEFPEMVRIQIEKAVPYSLDEITTDFEIIEQAEADSVVSAVAVHNGKLSEIAAPLLNGGFIPEQVTVYAAQRAATHAATGHALLIYREDETLVCVISENGKLSLTRMVEGLDAEQLQMDLPQLALSAELQGIGSSFPSVLLDESCLQLRETVEYLFASRPELINVETPPAAVKLNLLPESWRHRRRQLVRQAQWRRRLLWAGGAYAAVLILLALCLVGLRLAVGSLDRQVATDAPKVEFVRQTELKWKALAPAIDPRYYPIEVLLQIFDSLPSPDVRITAYNQSARQVSVDGEASTTALAYQFAEKVKKNAELRTFQFEMAAPRILPNDHAQFRLEGKPR
ncbi:MAG: hypothetical protein ABJB22_00755 [Verrucomicrobiota bacterium]